MNFVLKSKTNKVKSTEILVITTLLLTPLYICNAQSQNINERSTMKEDESALLVYLLTSLCLLGNLWDKTLCPDPATCTENCCLGKISDPSLSCLKCCFYS